MGGKEALKKLIEIDPTVNAIVSSGYATDATMSRYQDFGFHGVIAKPVRSGRARQNCLRRDRIESRHDRRLSNRSRRLIRITTRWT